MGTLNTHHVQLSFIGAGTGIKNKTSGQVDAGIDF